MLSVEPFRESHLAKLVLLANQHLELVPPGCACVSEEALHTITSFYEVLWAHHYPDLAATARIASSLVAVEDGVPIGMVITRPDILELEEAGIEDDLSGEIALLVFDPERPEAGDALLKAAERFLVAEGCSHVEVSGRCPIGIGWSGIPETWRHVTSAYENAGYEWVDGWIVLTCDTAEMSVDPSPLPPSMHVLFTDLPEKREWRLEVYNHEQFAAECEARGVPPHLEGCAGFDDWMVIEWISVNEEFQGKGLGYWLMMKQFLYHLRSGRKNALLWTGPDNTLARSFYNRLGFTDGPQTRVYQKNLT